MGFMTYGIFEDLNDESEEKVWGDVNFEDGQLFELREPLKYRNTLTGATRLPLLSLAACVLSFIYFI